MKFALNYYGPIKSAGDAKTKHAIRIALHDQVMRLCSAPPFDNVFDSNAKEVEQGRAKPYQNEFNGKVFRYLVTEHLKTVVDLDITLLLPHKIGSIVVNGGDIDNRIKTLFDALRVPSTEGEVPDRDTFDYSRNGMYCLLQDDKLIEKVTISAYQDYSAVDDQNVKAIIIVNTRITVGLWGNLNFV